jgi:hypothetical protein
MMYFSADKKVLKAHFKNFFARRYKDEFAE